MDIREIFENFIKVEPKVMSLDSLFNNPERVAHTNYKPSYQRNYVWDDEKATYFIESILLGTEIPPLVYFRNGDDVEIIDGRQRYETILRFTKGGFKLKKNGLQKFQDSGIANKSINDIEDKLVELFYDTKLRIIEFSFNSKSQIDDEIEETVKKEIFKRYNSGITPLKPTEIDKAAYFTDDLNSYLKEKLQADPILYRDVLSLLHFEKSNIEIILKKIRQLLVQHQIPIKYFGIKKDSIISKYYEFLFSNIDPNEIPEIFHSFIEKINLLKRIKQTFSNSGANYNRLITETLFWAFSVINNEGVSLQAVNPEVIQELVAFINSRIELFGMERSSFSKELFNRYEYIAKFFETKFAVDFHIYLYYNTDFKEKNKQLSPKNKQPTSFDELRINKPEPSTTAIVDICRQMVRQRFLVRPPYQRNEVINKKKSSSIIESILLGIKLPPIFVFKRSDGLSEVLDGQQRLLSILGFIQEKYLDENNKLRPSDKDGYALNLKNGILKGLNGKTFKQLSPEDKNKIKNFDLSVIEISQNSNPNFEQIDLFIRLNNKPYPIKEDTFEMWNSYISRDIIETIKSIHSNNKEWFYFRKNNSRMEDENIYTALIYFQYNLDAAENLENYQPKGLDIYKVLDKINLRVKAKNEISKVLEDVTQKDNFIQACHNFEFTFISKVKELLSEPGDNSNLTLNKNLDAIFSFENGRRTQQSFYALWYFLFDLSLSAIREYKSVIRNDLKKLFDIMAEVRSKADFDDAVEGFKKKFNAFNPYQKNSLSFASLGDISISAPGLNLPKIVKSNSTGKDVYPFYKKIKFNGLNIEPDDVGSVLIDEKFNEKNIFDARGKILIRKYNFRRERFTVFYTEKRFAFGNDVFCFIPKRYGFQSKYVLAILQSRYAYYSFNYGDEFIDNIRFYETKAFSISELKSMQIPVIQIGEQLPFVRIVDYLLVTQEHTEQYLFFERLLDAMVYELFLKDEFINNHCEVLKYITDIPELGDKPAETVGEAYHKLSEVDSPITASLTKLLNVEQIAAIENAFTL